MKKFLVLAGMLGGFLVTAEAYRGYRTVVYERAPMVYYARPVVYQDCYEEVPVVVRPRRVHYYRPCPRFYACPRFGGGINFSFGF